MVLTDSLSRSTTAHNFLATRASLSWAWAGSERFNRVNAWYSALNSFNDVSERPLSRSQSIMDSIARPADGDDALASAASIRMSLRRLF
eukprot:758246-Pleurochrysis_carterae.AAC.3